MRRVCAVDGERAGADLAVGQGERAEQREERSIGSGGGNQVIEEERTSDGRYGRFMQRMWDQETSV